jgi:hypothetical protein
MEAMMRSIFLLAAAGTLGSCTMNNGPVPIRQVAGADTVAYLLAGRTAGPPVKCLPSYGTNDMTVLDSQTVAYRYGGATTYLVHLSPGCGDIALGAALVTRSWGTQQTCAGDIARTLSGGSRIIGGSCSVLSIVPYSRPRS